MKKEMGGKRKCDIDICTSIYIYIYICTYGYASVVYTKAIIRHVAPPS